MTRTAPVTTIASRVAHVAIIARLYMWASWIMCAIILGMLLAAPSRAQDLDRRVVTLEDAHADRRLSVIETRLDSIEYLGKGILLAVASQLAINGFNGFQLRRRFRPRGGE